MSDYQRTAVYNPKRFTQGAYWSMTLLLKDDNGNPIDLTGYAAKMQFRKSTGAPVVLELSSPTSGITITPAQGRIDIAATAAQTALFVSKLQYDLKLTPPDSHIAYPIAGEIDPYQRITE